MKPQFVLINGLPGSGKSTIARTITSGLSGVLRLDVDDLRGLLGISATDFWAAGDEVRPLVSALATQQWQLRRHVVMPQLFIEPEEIDGLVSVAASAGAEFTHTFIDHPVEDCWRRVRVRAEGSVPDSAANQIFRLLNDRGGSQAIDAIRRQLAGWDRSRWPPRILSGPDAVTAFTRDLRMLFTEQSPA